MYCDVMFFAEFNICHILLLFYFFFFNDTATTEIYTLSLHDALPISGVCAPARPHGEGLPCRRELRMFRLCGSQDRLPPRSEEHTSELQSRLHLVCRLLLEKKKKNVRAMRSVKKVDIYDIHDSSTSWR